MEKIRTFKKPDRPIDMLPGNPILALKMVWKDESVQDIVHSQIANWFYMALSNECSIYANDNIKIRAQFIEFYADLLPIIEATHCYNVRSLFFDENQIWPDEKQMHEAIHGDLGCDYFYTYISDTDIYNPCHPMVKFCIKYPLDYVRRELWDFFQGVETYNGPFRKHVATFFSDYYLRVLTMVEASYVLCSEMNKSD
jgi:hypothetical protein